MKHLFALILMLCASTAHAACLPPIDSATLTPKWVVSDNPRGCWAGWYCPDSSLYVAAATKQQCSLTGVKRAVATWATSPNVGALIFGSNPHTDPTLRAVWEPERSKLDKLK